MAREASGAEVAVHTAEDVAGAARMATELIAPGDVVFVKASSEYGLGACARELTLPATALRPHWCACDENSSSR